MKFLFRDDESLAKCMYATMKLLDEGKATSDELCMKFLTQCLPSVSMLTLAKAMHLHFFYIQYLSELLLRIPNVFFVK